MSISDGVRTAFDEWLADEYAARGPFTALVILVAITETKVQPLASTFFHVIGTEVTWNEMTELLAGSRKKWNGVAFFPVTGRDDGPLRNDEAGNQLRALEARVDESKLVLNEGHFFDGFGHRMTVEEVEPQ